MSFSSRYTINIFFMMVTNSTNNIPNTKFLVKSTKSYSQQEKKNFIDKIHKIPLCFCNILCLNNNYPLDIPKYCHLVRPSQSC